jgi:hypothetical protein
MFVELLCKASDRCSGKYSYIDRNCKALALAKVTFRKETPLIQVIDALFCLWRKRFGKAKGILMGVF